MSPSPIKGIIRKVAFSSSISQASSPALALLALHENGRLRAQRVLGAACQGCCWVGGLQPTFCAPQQLGSVAVPTLHPAPSLACSHPPCSTQPCAVCFRGGARWRTGEFVGLRAAEWTRHLWCADASVPSWSIPQPGVILGHRGGILPAMGVLGTW